uniref:F-box domain-containing protein n=1 Tax=Panagrolaimus superbus TaxID=310955 RepID=A0A914Y2L1_9BILA
MCPLSTPTHSKFDWNTTPFLIKKKIIENLSPRSAGIFSAVSRECYYLTQKYRHLHIVDSLSINLAITKNGNFKATIFEGEDFDDERSKNDCIFDRNASTHLALTFENSPETIIFEEKIAELIEFLKHVHAIGTIEIDIQCDETSAAAMECLGYIWKELGSGLESAQKIILHRFPNSLLSSLFKSIQRCDSLALLSCRRSISDSIDSTSLLTAAKFLPPLKRFVCDYLIRPNDALLQILSPKFDDLELLYIFGISEKTIESFLRSTSISHNSRLIFSFSEGFYQWARIEKAIRNSSKWIEKLPINTLPAAYSAIRGDSNILIGLIKPYRALL